jgi:SAM-dependent methyltransferase
MNMEISDAKKYSELWEKESDHLESNGIYKDLSEITPQGNTIEFGCGVGRGTKHLADGRRVLSLDNNQHLIDIAKRNIKNDDVIFHRCDFFELCSGDKIAIENFESEIIVGWFIGSHGVDIFSRTPEEPDAIAKSKLYREKIEDIITSPEVCLPSVKHIHLVSRRGVVSGISEELCFQETKRDYDTHVFNRIGFEVYDVKNIPWPREGSDFMYGQVHNPILAGGEVVPMITSILARPVQVS